MKVLVVDSDATRAAGVVDALAGSGAEAAVAPSASFALTMLEWNRQDVIVSRAHVGDMDGRELCTLVRSDPSTKNVRFVLVANDVTPAQSAELGVDLVIPDGLIGQAIVTRVMHMMRRESESAAAAASSPAAAPSMPTPAPVEPPSSPSVSAPEPATPVVMASPEPIVEPQPPIAPPEPEPPVAETPPPVAETPPPVAETPPPVVETPPPVVETPPPVAPPAPVAPPRAAPTLKGAAPPPPPLSELEAVGLNGAMRTFQGALGTLELEALAQAIAKGGKTGRLLLVLTTGGGMVAFDAGRIVHAEIGNTTGETAFQTLVSASHREPGGKFCFIPSDPRELANVPKTISRTVSQLLEAAKALDEEK